MYLSGEKIRKKKTHLICSSHSSAASPQSSIAEGRSYKDNR
jgi:hypothetical protein